MKKYYVILFLLFTAVSFSQNFPYLNASTGNPNFFTDTDTNMYIIHGNRLVKTDKNFTPIWVNTYGSLSIKKILLSKTGSMYFIAGTYSFSPGTIIGKIEANGNVSWMKSTAGMSLTVTGSTVTSGTVSSDNLFLDSNNNLLVSGSISGPGNAAIIKLDTSGNFIKARTFQFFNYYSPGAVPSVNILNEVSGIYNVVCHGISGMGGAYDLEVFSYSDSGDSTLGYKQYYLGSCNQCNPGFKFDFYKSKMRSDVFYMYGHYYSNNAYKVSIGKYKMNSTLWGGEYRWNGALGFGASAMDEDAKGNIFAVANVMTSLTYHHSGFFTMDSTGAYNQKWIKYFNGYNSGSFNYPDDRLM